MVSHAIAAGDLLSLKTDPSARRALKELIDKSTVALAETQHDAALHNDMKQAVVIVQNYALLAEKRDDVIRDRASFSDKRAIGWALGALEAHDSALTRPASVIREALHVENAYYDAPRAHNDPAIPVERLKHIRRDTALTRALETVFNKAGTALRTVADDEDKMREVMAASKIVRRLMKIATQSSAEMEHPDRGQDRRVIGWALKTMENVEPELHEAAKTVRNKLGMEDKEYELPPNFRAIVRNTRVPSGIAFEHG